jgi:threonine dehydratase
MIEIGDIQAARTRIQEAIYLSPCAHTHGLSERLGAEVYLKLENLQMSGSFKERGACNRLRLATAGERARGVVAASAGNHAQGVAHHAKRLGIDATIVMPLSTPMSKVEATRRLGGRVLLHGQDYDEAAAEATRIADAEGRLFVHPFDDPAVMAGQGTIGLELIEQVPDLDMVIVPVGGGGLIGGIATAIKAVRPAAEVIGVEPASVPSLGRALEVGGPVTLPPARTLADGIAVRRVGEAPFEVARRRVDRVVTVDDEEIAEAILVLLEHEKTVAEAAGAAALAALLAGRVACEGRRVVALVSGGNIDVQVLSRIIERGLAKSGRLLRLRVVLRDEPGQLAELLAVIAREGANVLSIRHDRVAARVELSRIVVELDIETRGEGHVARISAALERGRFERLTA